MRAEITLWRWQYTDEFGKAAPLNLGAMTEEDAKHYRDAVKVESSL